MSVAAYVPDLMDRSRVAAAVPGVVDLGRPGVLDVVPRLAGRRVVGFGSHVDVELLDAARTAGCGEVLRRSEFFRRLGELLEG